MLLVHRHFAPTLGIEITNCWFPFRVRVSGFGSGFRFWVGTVEALELLALAELVLSRVFSYPALPLPPASRHAPVAIRSCWLPPAALDHMLVEGLAGEEPVLGVASWR